MKIRKPTKVKLSDLRFAGLTGGMLIEYWKGGGVRDEHSRSKISSIGFSPTQKAYFEIHTEGEEKGDAHMGLALDYYGEPNVDKLSSGAFIWQSGMGWYYVAIPTGIEDPSKEILQAWWDSEYEEAPTT